MFQGLKQVNFTVKPLKFLRTLQEIIELHLIPCYFNSIVFIKGSITAANKTHTSKPYPRNQTIQRIQKGSCFAKIPKGFSKKLRNGILTLSLKLLYQEFHCTAKNKNSKIEEFKTEAQTEEKILIVRAKIR